MTALLIRAEDWDRMAQSGREHDDEGRRSLDDDVVTPWPAAPRPVDLAAVTELLEVLARAREAEQQLRTCIEQIQVALRQHRA